MSNDNTTNSFEELTFPSLLNKYDRILVPMIQRDYAQGRTEKKAQEVRTNILNDIFDKESVHFDLIFGSCEKRNENDGEKFCFVPVDGQQRLTTLFLLFLYAKKVKGLWNDLNLSKFSYDTRRAAADFCKKVATEEWNVSNGKVSDSIKDSVWFMNYWENDPTVAGMLNMLDDIHEKAKVKVFPDLDNVTFYFFDLESKGLNENLYLKMNSRGKPLTAFENLKASIEKELPEGEFAKNWKYNMDRDWTNAFWNSEKPEETDKNITAFIVRFLSGYWNAFMENREDDKIVADKLKDINSKDNYADFIPFEPIKTVLNYKKNKKKDAFIRLEAAFASVVNVEKIKPSWEENITSTNLSEYKIMAVVFAYVLFDGNTQAMRVAWNLAENTVSGYDNFIIYCRRIGEIYRYIEIEKIDIYHVLESNERKFNNPSAQMTEEIAKAKQILNGEQRSDRKTWEEIIIEAEKYAFFKGAIRFLFTDGEGKINWCDFDTKWGNAQKYFDENGVKEEYKVYAILLRALLSRINIGENWFGYDKEFWHTSLLKNDYQSAIHYLLTTPQLEIDKTCSQDWITQDPLLHNLLCCNKSWHILTNWNHYDVLTRYSQRRSDATSHNEIVVLNDLRNKLLNSNDIEIPQEHKVAETIYLYGWDIQFKYQDECFQWHRDGYVRMIKDLENCEPIVTPEKKWYCFCADNIDTDNFTAKLNGLIEDYNKSKS